jgi:hypothetical protein
VIIRIFRIIIPSTDFELLEESDMHDNEVEFLSQTRNKTIEVASRPVMMIF